jgi:hypothetical protein
MAKTKEEYMDQSTLKKRLQTIAVWLKPEKREASGEVLNSQAPSGVSAEAQKRIEQLRTTNQNLEKVGGFGVPQPITSSVEMPSSRGSSGQVTGQSSNQDSSGAINNAALTEMLNLKHLKPYHSAIAELQINLTRAARNQGTKGLGHSRRDEGLTSKQRKKVIRQQQQRLISLRHASKCTVGPSCKIKFCPQMVKLWNHMKKCRNKDCTTPHCLSSRCVLNHYKICKDEGRTSTCEVCAPVMDVIRYQDLQQLSREGPNDSSTSTNALTAPDSNNQSSYPPTNNLLASAPPPEDQDSKIALVAQVREKQIRSDEQYKILKQLQQQLNMQLQHHQRNNILPGSEMEGKIRTQRTIIMQCKDQYLKDQKDLMEVSNRLQKKLDANKNNKPPSQEPPNVEESDVGCTPSAPDGMPENLLPNVDLTIFDGLDSNNNDDDFGLFEPTRKRVYSDLSNDAPPDPDREFKLIKVGSSSSFGNIFDDKFPVENEDEEADKNNISTTADNGDQKSDSDPDQIASQILPLIQTILDDPFGWLFRDPVDPVELKIPDYFDIIKNPMDLNLVKKRLNSRYYDSLENAESDVKLVFENAIKYNGEDSDVGQMALQFLETFTNSCKRVE